MHTTNHGRWGSSAGGDGAASTAVVVQQPAQCQRQTRSQARAQLLAVLHNLWKRIPIAAYEITFCSLDASDLGHALVAFGFSPTRDPWTVPAVDCALHAAIAAELTPAQKVVANSLAVEYIDENRRIGSDFALKEVGRLDYPFEARLRLETVRGELLQKLPSMVPADAAVGRVEDVRGFIEGLCVHEIGMVAGANDSKDSLLFSFRDHRTEGQARTLILATHGVHNSCDAGCFCAGAGFDILDVLYPDASESEGVWAFAQSFGSYADSYGLQWQVDLCATDSATKLAAAAGVDPADVHLVLHAVTAIQDARGEARRTTSTYEYFERLMRWRIGNSQSTTPVSAVDEHDRYAADNYRKQEDNSVYHYAGYDTVPAGPGLLRRVARPFVDIYEALVMPIYPQGYAGSEHLPSSSGPDYAKYGVRKRFGGHSKHPAGALAWLITTDRRSLLSVVKATKGWGARFSTDHHTSAAEQADQREDH